MRPHGMPWRAGVLAHLQRVLRAKGRAVVARADSIDGASRRVPSCTDACKPRVLAFCNTATERCRGAQTPRRSQFVSTVRDCWHRRMERPNAASTRVVETCNGEAVEKRSVPPKSVYIPTVREGRFSVTPLRPNATDGVAV